VAGVIATVIYRSKDEPRYILGRKLTNLLPYFSGLMTNDNGLILDAVAIGFLIMGLIILPSTAMIYRRINASRDALARRDGYKYSDEERARMGDRSPDFRYIL
jgi:hypothetical protein